MSDTITAAPAALRLRPRQTAPAPEVPLLHGERFQLADRGIDVLAVSGEA